jgi:hypothetical protein
VRIIQSCLNITRNLSYDPKQSPEILSRSANVDLPSSASASQSTSYFIAQHFATLGILLLQPLPGFSQLACRCWSGQKNGFALWLIGIRVGCLPDPVRQFKTLRPGHRNGKRWIQNNR